MSYYILEKLFGNAGRVKIMKLFLFGSEEVFDKDLIINKSKVPSSVATKEIKLLLEIGLIKKKIFIKTENNSKTKKNVRNKIQGYVLNKEFSFLTPLRNLLINNEPLRSADIVKRIGKTGKIKLIVMAGVFIQNEDSRLDLLIVGDDVKERNLKNVINTMESEIGKELNFTFLKSIDFAYRQSVCDRLIRDVFDYPHEVILDKIGL